jgi:cytochrome c2
MPTIFVSPAAAIQSPDVSPALPWLVGGAGFVIAATGVLFLLRKGVRWATAVILIGLLVVGYGFATAAGIGGEVEVKEAPQNITSSLRGQDLFAAKGCLTCHAHASIDRDQPGMIFVDAGPDLTDFSASPDYLRRWLADPTPKTPGTYMPDLQLSEAEIEDLIAFINSD